MAQASKPKAGLLTPAVQALVGDILTETSRSDATPIDEYIEMIQTSPIVGTAIELKVLLGLGMLGDYQNSDEAAQAFIRQCLEQMRGSLKLSVAELLCVGPLGFACSEWAPIAKGGKWMIDAIQIIDPRKYRLRGRKGAIEDLLYSGNAGDIVIPYDRVIHLTNQSHISFGSPYGVAECRRALAAYRGWKIVIAAALIAAKRRGEPVIIGFAASDQQVKVGEDELGNPKYITAPQALLNTLADLENNSVAATDLANRIETIEAADGGLILQVLERLQQLQLMAFWVPESILNATGVGDSNLNTGHRNILNLTVGGAIDQIKERLIEDVIRPLLVWEFGEGVEDFGNFQAPKAQEDGAIDIFNALTNALYNGAFAATDLDVINRMRDLAGLPTVTEIVAPLQGAPTDIPVDEAIDPAADPADPDVASMFAAPKAKGKKGKRQKKNCTKGINCGGSCQRAKRPDGSPTVCKTDDPTPAVKKKARTNNGGGGGGGEVPSPTTLHPLAQSGAGRIGADLAKLDALLTGPDPNADRARLEKAFDAVFDKDPAKAFESPEWKALGAIQSKDIEVLALMGGIREKMFQIDRSEAEALAGKAKILKSAGKSGATEAEIRSNLADFYQLSGGRGSSSLKKIKYDDERAYADRDGSLNVGKNGSKEADRAAFFHEMGHHVEFQSSKTRDSLNDWIDKRSGGANAVPLSTFPGKAHYPDSEVTRPGKFIDPYVGKIYDDKSTEALSMGVERFRSPEAMLDFYKQDREHFLITVGALND